MTLFDTMFAAAAVPILHQVFGTEVTLRRGSLQTAGVVADWSVTNEPTTERDGLLTQPIERTWYVDHADYVFSEQTARPQTGERLDDGTDLWEIVPDGRREAVRDTGSGQWAIDTKRVEQ